MLVRNELRPLFVCVRTVWKGGPQPGAGLTGGGASAGKAAFYLAEDCPPL